MKTKQLGFIYKYNPLERMGLFFFSICLISFATYSQENITQFNKNLIEPAPQSAVFRTYNSPQPDLATGSVNVSIPLHDLSYRGVKIPLQLQYATSGIKVHDVSYPYGLGWTLTPGMRITRTILGRRDEGFRHTDSISEPTFDLLARSMRDEYTATGEALNYIDSQHDIYTLHLPGKSQSFLLNHEQDGSLTTISTSDNSFLINAKLHNGIHNSITFEVTDGNGVKYFFGNNTEDRGCNYVTAWMLDSIRLPNNEVIRLEWLKMRSVPEYSYDYFTMNDCYSYISSADFDEQGWAEAEGDNIQVLSKISYPIGCVDLKYAGQANSCLTDITAVNIENDTINHISLKYDSIDHRTRLLQQVDLRKDGKYTLSYNRTNISNLRAQDWWGFYNGKNNQHLYPAIKLSFDNYSIRFGTYSSGYTYDINGGDRSVDTALMKANILTKIEYPTGGWSKFEYEPHQFSQPDLSHPRINKGANIPLTCGGGLRVTKITTGGLDISIPMVTTYSYGTSENGLANVLAFPSPKTFIKDYLSYHYLEMPLTSELAFEYFRNSQVGSFSHHMDWHIGESPFWYSQVTVTQKYGGKQIYDFKRLLSNETTNDTPKKMKSYLPGSDWTYHMPMCLKSIFSKGILLDGKKEFKRTGTEYIMASSSKNDYYVVNDEIEKPILDATIRRAVAACNDPYQPYYPDVIIDNSHVIHAEANNLVYNNDNVYQPFIYEVNQKTEFLLATQNFEVTENGSSENDIFYSYTKYGLISSKTTVQGNDSQTLQYVYPFNVDYTRSAYQQAMADSLVKLFINNVPIKTIRTRNGDLFSIELTDYKMFHNMCLPWRDFLIKGGDTILIREMDYDTKGNIISMTTLNDKRECLIWDSAGQYPLFHITGLTYGELLDVNEVSMPLLQNATRIFESYDLLKSVLPADCSLEAFTAKPLVGRTMWIDNSGNIYRYTYDRRGRLIETSLDNHGILNRYEYRLHNEEEGHGVELINVNTEEML